jgi:hypothetical protein
MHLQDLPRKTASLDQAGLEKLLKLAREDHQKAKEAADLLEQDPKGFMAQVFRLTPTTRAAIQNTPDEELKQRLAGVVTALRSGHFKDMTLTMAPVPPHPSLEQLDEEKAAQQAQNFLTVKCSCEVSTR